MRLSRALLAPLLVVALLAPAATAGTEAAPDVVDNPDNNAPHRDLLAAWIESGPDGAYVTVKIEGADRPVADYAYGVVFTLQNTRYAPSVSVAPDGSLRGVFARPNYDAQRIAAPETWSNGLQDAEFERGSPAYFRFVIPWGATPGFDPGAALVNVGAFVGFYDRGDSDWGDVNTAESTNVVVLEKALLTPGVRGALPWIGAVVGALLLGGIGAFVHLRRRKAQQQAAPPGDAPR